MGWASRARESEEDLISWQVRQWTDFPWKESEDASRKDREENLERFAKAMTTAMRNKCAHYEPVCKRVRVGSAPQLMFEMTVPARTREEAAVRVMYWVKRASSVTRTVKRRGRTVRSPVGLHFPVGKVEVESA